MVLQFLTGSLAPYFIMLRIFFLHMTKLIDVWHSARNCTGGGGIVIQRGSKQCAGCMVRNQSGAWICHLEFDEAVEISLEICIQGVSERLFDNK